MTSLNAKAFAQQRSHEQKQPGLPCWPRGHDPGTGGAGSIPGWVGELRPTCCEAWPKGRTYMRRHPTKREKTVGKWCGWQGIRLHSGLAPVSRNSVSRLRPLLRLCSHSFVCVSRVAQRLHLQGSAQMRLHYQHALLEVNCTGSFATQRIFCAEIFVYLHNALTLFFFWGGSFSSVQLLSRVQLFVTSWTAARQASLSITNSWSSPKLMSIESVMPSNHLILCRPLLLLPLVFPSIRVFSNESALCIRWPKYWSFSFSISPSNEHSGLISFRMDWLDFLTVQESSPAPQFKSINSLALSFLYSPTLTSIHDYWKIVLFAGRQM